MEDESTKAMTLEAHDPNFRLIQHDKDDDCTLDPETHCCVVCGVIHDAPCPQCGARAYHKPGCPELIDSTAAPAAPEPSLKEVLGDIISLALFGTTIQADAKRHL